MKKCIAIELHPEDETRLVGKHEDGTVSVTQVTPLDGSGDRFTVTYQDGTVHRVSKKLVYRYPSTIEVWSCSNGSTWVKDGEQSGDVNTIRLVHLWLTRRYEAQQAGRKLTSIYDIRRIHDAQAQKLERLQPPTAAQKFFKKYNGQRISR